MCEFDTSNDAESSTAMLDLTVWGAVLPLGNLLKSGGVNALVWYTVATPEGVFAFDAEALPGVSSTSRTSFGGSTIEADIRLLPALLERAFSGLDSFANWLNLHFYQLAKTR